MKKTFVAIFAVFYLSLSSGATIHLHYCMGKLADWSLWQEKKSDQCSKCGMKKDQSKKECCKNENTLIKITIDQQSAGDIFGFVKLTPVILRIPDFDSSFAGYSSAGNRTAVSHAPPLNEDTGIYLFHCIFRI